MQEVQKGLPCGASKTTSKDALGASGKKTSGICEAEDSAAVKKILRSNGTLRDVFTLVHEMGHSYNYATGTADPAVYDPQTHEHILNADGTYSTDRSKGEAGCEYQTIGGVGYDEIDDGNERTDNPEGVSENAMRNYLGYGLRDGYWSNAAPRDVKDTTFVD